MYSASQLLRLTLGCFLLVHPVWPHIRSWTLYYRHQLRNLSHCTQPLATIWLNAWCSASPSWDIQQTHDCSPMIPTWPIEILQKVPNSIFHMKTLGMAKSVVGYNIGTVQYRFKAQRPSEWSLDLSTICNIHYLKLWQEVIWTLYCSADGQTLKHSVTTRNLSKDQPPQTSHHTHSYTHNLKIFQQERCHHHQQSLKQCSNSLLSSKKD